MTEMLLNVIWAALAFTILVIVPRRSVRASIALACILALLFPIISASDDLSADRETIERAALAVAAALLLFSVALVTLGRLEQRDERLVPIALVTASDPRSPPRA